MASLFSLNVERLLYIYACQVCDWWLFSSSTTAIYFFPPGKRERSSVTTSLWNILLLVKYCMPSSMPRCFTTQTHSEGGPWLRELLTLTHNTAQQDLFWRCQKETSVWGPTPDDIDSTSKKPLVWVILLHILWVASTSHLLCILKLQNSSAQSFTTSYSPYLLLFTVGISPCSSPLGKYWLADNSVLIQYFPHLHLYLWSSK